MSAPTINDRQVPPDRISRIHCELGAGDDCSVQCGKAVIVPRIQIALGEQSLDDLWDAVVRRPMQGGAAHVVLCIRISASDEQHLDNLLARRAVQGRSETLACRVHAGASHHQRSHDRSMAGDHRQVQGGLLLVIHSVRVSAGREKRRDARQIAVLRSRVQGRCIVLALNRCDIIIITGQAACCHLRAGGGGRERQRVAAGWVLERMRARPGWLGALGCMRALQESHQAHG